MISEATSFGLLRSLSVPTLVLDSQDSSAELTGMAAAVAGAMPHASHRGPAGETAGQTRTSTMIATDSSVI